MLGRSTISIRSRSSLSRRESSGLAFESYLVTDLHRRGGFIEYLLEREDVKPAWHQYTHHEFVQRMGDGTLPLDTFKNYMIQDYLYLVRAPRG